MGRKVSDGKSVRVSVPENTTIQQGDFVLLDGFFGLAVQQAVTGAGETRDIILNVEQGEYETSQITAADDFAKGDPVYWDAATGKLTTAAGTDNRLVGRVTVAKDAGGVIWFQLGPQV